MPQPSWRASAPSLYQLLFAINLPGAAAEHTDHVRVVLKAMPIGPVLLVTAATQDAQHATVVSQAALHAARFVRLDMPLSGTGTRGHSCPVRARRPIRAAANAGKRCRVHARAGVRGVRVDVSHLVRQSTDLICTFRDAISRPLLIAIYQARGVAYPSSLDGMSMEIKVCRTGHRCTRRRPRALTSERTGLARRRPQLRICDYLDETALCRLAQTGRAWNHTASDGFVWKRLYQRRFGAVSSVGDGVAPRG